MNHLLEVMYFGLMCLCCAGFLAAPVIALAAVRAGRAEPPPASAWAFLALASVGTTLCALASYWRAFGAPAGHPALTDVSSLCGLGAMVAGFVVDRRRLRVAASAFVAANGGTAEAALWSALRHPRLSLTRLAGRLSQGEDR